MKVTVHDNEKSPSSKGGGKPKGPPDGGTQQALHHPAAPMGPKPGQGMNPQEAMMFGMGDMGQFGPPMMPPPPPAPGAPLGPGGLPIGGNLPSSDPMMDPEMDGSSLFQALNMQLDPYSAGPEGHAPMDQPADLNGLLGMLALLKAGQGMQGGGNLSPSGVMNEPTHPGESIGLNPFNVIQ